MVGKSGIGDGVESVIQSIGRKNQNDVWPKGHKNLDDEK